MEHLLTSKKGAPGSAFSFPFLVGIRSFGWAFLDSFTSFVFFVGGVLAN
jgi:hypothetical protein